MADPATKVATIIEPALEDMGYELVRVQLQGGKRPVLQIMADRADGASMTVDDCADISRAISAVLDVEDPIPDAYHLEVSSPGIDRPLTRLKDYVNYAGFQAKVELFHHATTEPGGRRKFSGTIIGTQDDDAVVLEMEEGEIALPFNGIQKAKLILTDALIAHEQAKAGGKAGAQGGALELDEAGDDVDTELEITETQH
ncbi:MAG: ribosome maturation factor RimP [Alphaproteobacteria bacterium]|nr:ribosome maturation factor RimP [Alphaproteobacteria bacterium SS10]